MLNNFSIEIQYVQLELALNNETNRSYFNKSFSRRFKNVHRNEFQILRELCRPRKQIPTENTDKYIM